MDPAPLIFDGHCDGQNGLHTHFARQRNVCEGVASCERTLKESYRKPDPTVRFPYFSGKTSWIRVANLRGRIRVAS